MAVVVAIPIQLKQSPSRVIPGIRVGVPFTPTALPLINATRSPSQS